MSKFNYIQKYRKCWENNPDFNKWLRPTEFDNRAYCVYCKCDLTCKYVALIKHMNTRKHIRSLAEGTPVERASFEGIPDERERRSVSTDSSSEKRQNQKKYNFKPKKYTIRAAKNDVDSTIVNEKSLQEEEIKNDDLELENEIINPLYPLHEEYQPRGRQEKFAWLGQEVIYEINLIKSAELQRQASWAIQAILKKYIIRDKTMRRSDTYTQT